MFSESYLLKKFLSSFLSVNRIKAVIFNINESYVSLYSGSVLIHSEVLPCIFSSPCPISTGMAKTNQKKLPFVIDVTDASISGFISRMRNGDHLSSINWTAKSTMLSITNGREEFTAIGDLVLEMQNDIKNAKFQLCLTGSGYMDRDINPRIPVQ